MMNTQGNTTKTTSENGFGTFRWAPPAASIAYQAVSVMLTELAKFSTFYTEMQNDYLNFQKDASQAASKSTESAFEHDASGMRAQAITGFVSAGMTGASGLTMGAIDGGTMLKTSGAESQLGSLDAFEHEFKNPTAETEVCIGTAEIERSDAAIATLKRYDNDSSLYGTEAKLEDGKYQVPADAKQAIALNEGEHSERIETVKQQKERVQNQMKEAYDRRNQLMQYVSIGKDLTTGISNSSGTYYQQEQKSAQGKEEAEKVLAQTNEQILQQAANRESSQFGSNAEQMTQLTQLISQASQTADRYNG